MNWNNKSYNLPKFLFALYYIIKTNNSKKTLIHAICFVFVFTLIITGVTSWTFIYLYMTSHTAVTQQQIDNILVMCASFSFLLSVLIFSYGTIQETQKILRQFFLWIFILIIILIFSGFQLYSKLQSSINDILVIEIVLLILGLVFIITTVADKGKELFHVLFLKDKRVIEYNWNMYNNKFSLVSVYSLIKTKFEGFHLQYSKLHPKKRINSLVFLFASFLLIPAIVHKLSTFFNYIIPVTQNKIWALTISLHNGNKEDAKNLLSIFFIMGVFIYFLRKYIISFKSYNTRNKLLSMGPLVLLLVILLLLIDSYFHAKSQMLRSIGLFSFITYIALLFMFDIINKIKAWFRK